MRHARNSWGEFPIRILSAICNSRCHHAIICKIQRIASEWRKRALAACDLDVKAYWVCRQDAGFSVILKCRAENDAMNACVARFAGDATAWQEFHDGRVAEIAPALLAKRAAALEARLAGLRAAAAATSATGNGSASV